MKKKKKWIVARILLCILLITDLSTTRLRSMNPAIVLERLPEVYVALLEATALVAGAYAIAHNFTRTQPLPIYTEPTPPPVSQVNSPAPATTPTQPVSAATLIKQELTQKYQAPSPAHVEQAVHDIITPDKFMAVATTSKPEVPIQLSQTFARPGITIQHENDRSTYRYGNGYLQIQAVDARRDDFSKADMEAFIAREFYKKNPAFRYEINRQVERFIDAMVYACTDASMTEQLYYRLHLYQLPEIDFPFGHNVHKARYFLAHVFFDSKGNLRPSNTKVLTESIKAIYWLFYQEFSDYEQKLRKYGLTDYPKALKKAREHYYRDKFKHAGTFLSNTIFPDKILDKIADSAYNKKLLQLFTYCENKQFDQARALKNQLNDHNARFIFDQHYSATYDAFGMQKVYADDPAWRTLSATARRQIMASPDSATLFTKYLHLRSEHPRETNEQIYNACLHNQDDEEKKYSCGTGQLPDDKPKDSCGTGLLPVQEIPKGNCIPDSSREESKLEGCGTGKLDPEIPDRKCNGDIQTIPAIARSSPEETTPASEIEKEFIPAYPVDEKELDETKKEAIEKLKHLAGKIAVEKAKEERLRNPEDFEQIKKDFYDVLELLAKIYGAENLNEAKSVFRINDKTIQKHINLLKSIEVTASRLALINQLERWITFKPDPAHGNEITDKTIEEAYVGVLAELKGLVSIPIHRDRSGDAEFIDIVKNYWDVKSTKEYSISGKYTFNPESFIQSIKRELLKNSKILVYVGNLSIKNANLIFERLKKELNITEQKKITFVDEQDRVKHKFF